MLERKLLVYILLRYCLPVAEHHWFGRVAGRLYRASFRQCLNLRILAKGQPIRATSYNLFEVEVFFIFQHKADTYGFDGQYELKLYIQAILIQSLRA